MKKSSEKSDCATLKVLLNWATTPPLMKKEDPDELRERVYVYVCVVSFLFAFISCFAIIVTVPMAAQSVFDLDRNTLESSAYCNDSMEELQFYLRAASFALSLVAEQAHNRTSRQYISNFMITGKPGCCTPGPKGARGRKGHDAFANCPTCPQGPPGSFGPPGARGDSGDPGPPGANGRTGDIGACGVKGNG
ncbi:CRE-DPY-2 protein [Aphelenchoides avenae]|nr:CRE-DPY-2 protein [Aphelenchus avenae]